MVVGSKSKSGKQGCDKRTSRACSVSCTDIHAVQTIQPYSRQAVQHATAGSSTLRKPLKNCTLQHSSASWSVQAHSTEQTREWTLEFKLASPWTSKPNPLAVYQDVHFCMHSISCSCRSAGCRHVHTLTLRQLQPFSQVLAFEGRMTCSIHIAW